MATRTLARRVSIGHYPRPNAVGMAALELGMQPGSVHQLMYGRDNVFHRCAVIVSAMVRSGQSGRADRLLAQITAARRGITPLRLTDELIQVAQDADLDEDVAENHYRGSQTHESLVEWRRRLKQQIAESLKLLTAIETELEA